MKAQGLTRVQRDVARTVLRVAGPDGFHLAGGAALVASRLTDRPTRDIDAFTSAATDVGAVADRVAAALDDEGFDVTINRRSESFASLTVIARDARRGRIEVDLGRDYREWPGSTTSLGPTLSTRELAAGKVLALFGRVQARDLADVAALVEHFPLEDMLADAKIKDPGFDRRIMAQMVRMVVAIPDGDWPVGVDIAAARAFGLDLAKYLEA